MSACENRRTVNIRQERYEVPCGSRTCDACGIRWEKDWRVTAVAASEHLTGAVALITVTAPGTGFFSNWGWGDQEEARDGRDDWNRSARRRWRQLHLEASYWPRRYARSEGADWRVLYRSWEYQKRGLLHVHLVLPFGTPEQQRATRAYVGALHTLAREHAFGYVLGGDKHARPTWRRAPEVVAASAEAAARYVCKYVASIGAGKESMRTVAQRTAKRGSILYVSRRLTGPSATTMGSLRVRRRVTSRYPWATASRASWRAACLCDGLQRGRAPLTPDTEHRIRSLSLPTQPGFLVDADTGEVIPPSLAPPPLALQQADEPPPTLGAPLALTLASVLLGDQRRPELGPVRVRATVEEV